MESGARSGTSANANALERGFEFRLDQEELLHSVLSARRAAQRVQFRPGVSRSGGAPVAADVVQQERTKKKLARAFLSLRDEYGVDESMIREALAYTNNLEDALQFVSLQYTSDELPTALKARPQVKAEDRKQAVEGSLGAEINANASEAESRSVDDRERDDLPDAPSPVISDSWDDAVDEQADDEPAAPREEATTKDAKTALSWTQQYVQLMAQRAEEEAQADAMTKEEKEILELEEQYNQLLEAVQAAKQRKNAKKRQKMLSQEVQATRQRLIALGWDEARYRQQRGLTDASSGSSAKKSKGKRGKKGVNDEHEDKSVPSDDKKEPLQANDDTELPRPNEIDIPVELDILTTDETPLGSMFDDDEATPGQDENDEDEDGGGLFGLLEQAEDTIVSADDINKSAAVDDEAIAVVSSEPEKASKGKKRKGKNALKAAAAAAASSATVWTGKSPRDHLQEFCTKRRLPRPVFKKVAGSRPGRHLYSVVVDWKTHKQEVAIGSSHPDGFASIDEAKDTVTTYALYELTPDLPLYRVLPPAYRDMWLAWVKQKEKEAADEAEAEKDDFDAVIDDIFRAIPTEIAAKAFIATLENDSGSAGRDANGAKPVNTTKTTTAGDTDPATLDDWDVDDWDADLPDDGTSAIDGSIGNGSGGAGTAESVVDRAAVNDEPPNTHSLEMKEQFERRARSDVYQKHLQRRAALPITSFKQQVLDALDAHNVILVSGETGCGKSTQVPQFLLEDQILSKVRGDSCQIVCTQPRRLAATSLAERVSKELGERELGVGDSLCGYQIRLETRMTRNTRLLFCTTGVLLRRLQDPRTLEEEITHVIVDEVHERDLQNDVLLSMLREVLASSSARLKVILMSATLNADSFQRYFGGESKCPMITVPGRTFPVKEYFLEDALEATGFVVDEISPAYRRIEAQQESAQVTISGRGGTSYTQKLTWETTSDSRHRNPSKNRSGDDAQDYSDQTLRMLECLDPSVINYELIAELIEYLIANHPELQLSSRSDRGAGKGNWHQPGSASILVFLPGLQEISSLLDLLGGSRTFRDSSRFHLIPLHSSLSPQEQQRVFDMPPGSVRIIAATNIAETSLTIEDVKVVIDSGKVKQMRHDSARRTNVLDEIWISRANAKQRMGRAGRTSDGICYRLFPRGVYYHEMDEQPVAEIRRAPLASLCLQIKSFGIASSCGEFLGGCLDPPPIQSVQDALEELFEIGALDRDDESLTTLGEHLAKLPVDVKVGKLLLLGAIFGEFDAISTCAAILETKSPFVAPFGRQADMKEARKQFIVGSSDILTDVNAFQSWHSRFASTSRGGLRGKPTGEEKQFCFQTFLNRRSLVEITKLKRQFSHLVAQLGFLPSHSEHQSALAAMSKQHFAVVSALLFAGLTPNLVQIERSSETSKRTLLREQDRGVVVIHPGSVNHKVTAFASPFLTFAIKLHTSQVYLPQSSLVMPAPICLFSHHLELLPQLGRTDKVDAGIGVRVNDWVVLQSSFRSALLLQETRALVHAFIAERMQNPPYRKLSSKGQDVDTDPIAATLSTLLVTELDQRDPNALLTRQLGFQPRV